MSRLVMWVERKTPLLFFPSKKSRCSHLITSSVRLFASCPRVIIGGIFPQRNILSESVGFDRESGADPSSAGTRQRSCRWRSGTFCLSRKQKRIFAERATASCSERQLCRVLPAHTLLCNRRELQM